MKKSKIKVLMILVLIFAVSFMHNDAKAGKNEEKQDEICKYIVVVKDKNIYNKVKGNYEDVDSVNGDILVVELTDDEAEELDDSSGVLSVEEDYVLTASSSKSTSKSDKRKIRKSNSKKNSKSEWNMQMIAADDNQVKNTKNKVKVAIIDSGIDESEDIDVVERKDFINPGEELNSVYEDLTGHGTSIAGIIAAKDNEVGITGVNSNVQLYSAKVLDGNNSAPVSRVIKAIYWAMDNDVDIISMSFGTNEYSAALEKAIKEAYDQGILIVAAAGNGGDSTEDNIEYPAKMDEVLAVGAVDTSGERCESSSVGEALEVMAPGEQILSTGAFGGVITSSGTSMAVPHVVGTAAVLWEKDLDCSNEFIRELLKASANSVGDEEYYGEGLIDLEYALEIYDDFKNNYNKKVQNGKSEEYALENASSLVDDNTSIVEEFTDVDYVEGRWLDFNNGHLRLVNENATGWGFSAYQLKLIKIGAIINDFDLPNKWKMPAEFHAYRNNYLANYLYVGKVARALYNGNHSWTVPIVNGQNAESYASMKNAIINYPWADLSNADVLVKNGLNANVNSMSEKAYVILGMSIHLATDVFAHQSYRNSNGNYIELYHSKDSYDCDNHEVVPQRFACAGMVTASIACDFVCNRDPSLWDFYMGYDSWAGNSFKLENMLRFASQIDPNLNSNLWWDFDNITYKPKP